MVDYQLKISRWSGLPLQLLVSQGYLCCRQDVADSHRHSGWIAQHCWSGQLAGPGCHPRPGAKEVAWWDDSPRAVAAAAFPNSPCPLASPRLASRQSVPSRNSLPPRHRLRVGASAPASPSTGTARFSFVTPPTAARKSWDT